MRASVRSGRGAWSLRAALGGTLLVAALPVVLAAAQPAFALERACSRAALAGRIACHNALRDDYWSAFGVCANVPDADERSECLAEAEEERSEALELCAAQIEARLELCGELGEEPYDPEFAPESFDRDFDAPLNPNPYWPLGVGDRWVYEGGDETIAVEVLDKTKRIEGVTCIVVNDRAVEQGRVKEETFDWYALSLTGAVHYCGEDSRELELFDGDDPQEPELIGNEGSWKAGRDGAKPGILMQAHPEEGLLYRQEWAFLEAEDVARVLSASYGYGRDVALDEHVPEPLARLLCDDDCVVTRDLTPIEPDVSERKYYAPGLGLFLEVDEETGDIVQLVECNLDPVCALLPAAAE